MYTLQQEMFASPSPVHEIFLLFSPCEQASSCLVEQSQVPSCPSCRISPPSSIANPHNASCSSGGRANKPGTGKFHTSCNLFAHEARLPGERTLSRSVNAGLECWYNRLITFASFQRAVAKQSPSQAFVALETGQTAAEASNMNDIATNDQASTFPTHAWITFSNSSLIGRGKILDTSSAAFSASGMASATVLQPNLTMTESVSPYTTSAS